MGTVSFDFSGSNNNDDVVSSGTVSPAATISGNTAETASAANSSRSSLSISVVDADAWIRLTPAATDAGVRKGTPVQAGQTWELPTSWWRGLYSGEVSIINAADGETPTYYVTEL